MIDLVIVGSGPAGLKLSHELISRGFDASDLLLVDMKKRIGRPVHCTGFISNNTLREFEVRPSRDIVLNRIKGFIAHFPDGRSIEVSLPHHIAVIVDREKLEVRLAERLSERGVNIAVNARIRRVVPLGHAYDLVVDGGGKHRRIRSRRVVLATGVSDSLAAELGFSRLGERLPAIQYEMEGVEYADESLVEIFLGSRYSEGLFAWIAPLGGGLARVGTATLTYPREKLRYLVEKDPLCSYSFKGSKIIRSYGGTVITCGPKSGLSRDGVALIGDVAGQTKPTTGGGLACISTASGMLARAIMHGRLETYQREWWAKMGREIRVQRAARLFLNSLNDKELSKLGLMLEELDLNHLLSDRGDMDYQSPVLVEAAKRLGARLFREPLLGVKAVTSLFKAYLH